MLTSMQVTCTWTAGPSLNWSGNRPLNLPLYILCGCVMPWRFNHGYNYQQTSESMEKRSKLAHSPRRDLWLCLNVKLYCHYSQLKRMTTWKIQIKLTFTFSEFLPLKNGICGTIPLHKNICSFKIGSIKGSLGNPKLHRCEKTNKLEPIFKSVGGK